MARVKATVAHDANYQRVLKGATGECLEQSQDGDTITVKWDWALKAEGSPPASAGAFKPSSGLVVDVPSAFVEAIEG